MNSDPLDCFVGKIGSKSCLRFAEVALGPGRALWRTFKLALLALALWGVAVGSTQGFSQGFNSNPAAVDGNSSARAALRHTTVHPAPIRMNVDWVVLPLTVIDQHGYICTDLEREHVQVFDNKVRQNILSFAIEDSPLAVGIVFDTSRSMKYKMEVAKEAALQFFKTANPQDLFMLIAFGERPYWVSDLTSDYEKLLAEALFVKSEGRTALLDAVYQGLAKLRSVKASRKALLVISDGGENHSRYTYRDVRKFVKEANVQIYTVGVSEPLGVSRRLPEEVAGADLLADLANISGGRPFTVQLPETIPDVTEQISRELRSQYVIGYMPSNLVRDGSWRNIKIKLRPPDGLPSLKVYAPSGYYAPTH